jgi:hypothetical protein
MAVKAGIEPLTPGQAISIALRFRVYKLKYSGKPSLRRL